MANDLNLVSLDALVADGSPITYGVVKPGEQGTIPFIRGGDIVAGKILEGQLRTITESVSRQYARTLLRGGEILMSLVGNPGQVAVVPERLAGANIARQVGVIRLKPDVNPQYVKYFLQSFAGQASLSAHSRGSVQQVINLKDLKTVQIPLPPLLRQDFIAKVLGDLDEKIELNDKVSLNLEAVARVIFKSWFVDFDPVRAKAAGKPTGLPKEISALFPSRLVDSDLGEIPEGWAIKEVGDLAEIVGGTTPSTKKAEYWEAGHHAWATPKDFSTLKAPVLLSTERCITDAGLAEIGSGLLPVGSVLLSSRAPIGYLAITEIPVAINQGFIGMKPKKEIPSEFLLLWCRFFKDTILGRANGSTFLEISKSNFRSIPLLCPSAAVLKAFTDVVSPFYRKIAMNEKETRTLILQRDALLPKLMSGEVRIKA